MVSGHLLRLVVDILPDRPNAPISLAISDCLLGSAVRYDGSSARSSFPHSLLDGLFAYTGICPEVGVGMTIPRKPIRLIGINKLVEVDDQSKDYTQRITEFAIRTSSQLSDAAGYVFMKNSPSCGLFKVKVYDESGNTHRRDGRGIHARTIIESLPDLPVEENGRLNDPVLRENFVTRVFAYAHWQACFGNNYKQDGLTTASRLIAFHSRYKYLLMAHSIPHYQDAGKILSDLRENIIRKAGQYRSVLMSGLSSPASFKGHANVLSHLQGYLKTSIDKKSRMELHDLILAYKQGEQPLMAVITLLKHHFNNFPSEYVSHQVYLDPHPGFARLRRFL